MVPIGGDRPSIVKQEEVHGEGILYKIPGPLLSIDYMSLQLCRQLVGELILQKAKIRSFTFTDGLPAILHHFLHGGCCAMGGWGVIVYNEAGHKEVVCDWHPPPRGATPP